MYFFTDFVYKILSYYDTFMVFFDTIPLGFTGVAGEKPAAVKTHEISQDALYFAPTVNFQNTGVLVRIQSISPQYNWMSNNDLIPQDTPVAHVAGFFNQSMPYIPLIAPFFVKNMGQISMQFTNDTLNPITGGLWTWAALRLSNPRIGNGWDYSLGFSS
jgi:hypothetical protein